MWTAETETRFWDKTVRGPEQSADDLNGQFAELDGRHRRPGLQVLYVRVWDRGVSG